MNSDDRRKGRSNDLSVSESFRSWRYLYWLLALFLLIVLFYAEENWRGRRALEGYKYERAAQGKKFDPAAFVPPPVADSENFARTPFLAPLFEFQPGTQKWRDTNALQRVQNIAPFYDSAKSAMKHDPRVSSNSWVHTSVDLVAWYDVVLQAAARTNLHQSSEAKASSPAEQTREKSSEPQIQASAGQAESIEALKRASSEVLAHLSEYNSVIEQIRADSGKPFSRFDIRYQEANPAAILLPHLSVLKRLTQVIQLRAFAELILGRNQEAFDDVKLLLYLSNASHSEPILISQLVRIAQVQFALETIAYGMRQWSGEQLEELQTRLGQFNFCGDIQRALEAEQVFLGGGVIDFIRRSSKEYNALASNNSEMPGVLLGVIPKGWFDFEKVNYYRLYDNYLVPEVIDLKNMRVNPSKVQQARDKIDIRLRKSPGALVVRHLLFASLLMPSLERAVRKAAFAQEGVQVASVACALERYRRANGRFPEALDLLIPQFAAKLAPDIITGLPLHYRREESGQYVLYSIGWNEVDDNGVVATGKKEQGAESAAPDQGDWVWREMESVLNRQ